MYQVQNVEDEFEPRITPKPASRLDCFTVPSVPEVSLIFDKPLGYKTVECVGFQSPVEYKTLTSKNNVSQSPNNNGSYAAWKQQNYSWKSIASNSADDTVSQKVQSNQNYVLQSYLTKDPTIEVSKECKEHNYRLRKDSFSCANYEGDRSYSNDNNCYKHNYQLCGDHIGYTKERDTRVQHNNIVRQYDSVLQTDRVCTDTNRYVINEKKSSPLYEKKVVTHNQTQQKVPFDDSINESHIQNPHINPTTLKRSEYQLPHYLGQQYPYFNVNYPFPQFSSFAAHNTDNQETVKNLLQIINSQNEQIKSLQIQVDRLLKMQEENLQEKRKCSCSYQVDQHNDQFFGNSNDTLSASNYITVPKSIKRNVCQSEFPKEKKKEDHNENETVNQNELVLTEAQTKKAFMEQKVSIGVMTSFEFTVQNSPFPVDIDDPEKKGSQQQKENLKLCSGVGIRDNNDSLRRYKNSFTRMPSGQLENIVEDSESYISSSQQQSSNLNASTSTRDLERQAYVDIQKETIALKSGSPKLGKNMTPNSKRIEDNIERNLGRTCMEEIRNYEIIKTPAIQKNAEYVLENKNGKISTPASANCKQLNTNNDGNGTKASNSVNSSDYYKDYRKEGQVVITKSGHCIEDSLILNGGDLRINERPPPTPEPSIHVDMHDYSSDDDSEKVKRSSKVGWTFYNNVLGQVNQLLQNSCVIDDQQQNQTKINQNERNENENKTVLDSVKNATLEQLKKLGISLNETPEVKELNSNNKMAFDLSFYPRLDYQTNMTQTTSAVNETNTSMHMKALALKYLTDEQLAELAVQRQGSTSLKHLTVSNVQGTNMSFATMRYLERYQLLPGKNNVQTEDISKVPPETPSKIDLKLIHSNASPKGLLRYPFNQTPKTSCPSKILDMSTLKQQPKLL